LWCGRSESLVVDEQLGRFAAGGDFAGRDGLVRDGASVMAASVVLPGVIPPSVTAPSTIAPSVTKPSVMSLLTIVTSEEPPRHALGFSPGAASQAPHCVLLIGANV
jgi:hypothetical protein